MAQDDVTMLDEQGKEIKIPRQEWLTEILPEGLRRAWDDPDSLYAVLVAALNMKAGAALNDGIRRLAEIEKDPQKPAVLEGVCLMQEGKVEEAESLFRSYIEREGPTASILTNLAKIQYDRGEKAQAEITLRQALELDANIESTLGWHLALQRQRGGEAAAEEALRRLAEQSRNWRARLWIAARLLREKRNDEALQSYRRIVAETDLAAEGLVQITGDLGRAGMAREMVDLLRPIYDLQTHGPLAGLNLLQAMITAGMSMEAADLLVELESIKHPALAEILKDMSNRLVEKAAAAKRNVPAAIAGGAEVKVAAVPLLNPVWTGWLNKPDWLPPQPGADAVKVAIFSLADLTRPRTSEGESDQKSGGDTGGLARSLPLFLAEALRLRSDAASLCVIPVAPRIGPATIGAPWPLPNMLAICPKEFVPDYLVCGALTRGSRGPKVELHVFRVRDKMPLKTLRVPAKAEDFTGAAAACERDLLAILAESGVHARSNADLPSPQGTDAYVASLGHLLVQALAAGGMIDVTRLPAATTLLGSYFQLAQNEPASPLPTLLAAAGMAATRNYAPAAIEEFKPRMLELIERKSAEFKVIRQIAPAVYKMLGEKERFAAARAAVADCDDPAYVQWLAGLV